MLKLVLINLKNSKVYFEFQKSILSFKIQFWMLTETNLFISFNNCYSYTLFALAWSNWVGQYVIKLTSCLSWKPSGIIRQSLSTAANSPLCKSGLSSSIDGRDWLERLHEGWKKAVFVSFCTLLNRYYCTS